MKKEIFNDQDLVSGLLAGKKKYLVRFYRIYAPQVRRFIFCKVSNREDGEEILQDTLISAIDSLALFSGRSSLFSWLCGIARHEIGDYYRKKRIKTVVFSKLPLVERFVCKALEPDAKVMRAEYEKRVKEALASLLPHYREVLELKYMDNLSVKDISQKLGMSFKACESVLNRARRAFELAYEQAA